MAYTTIDNPGLFFNTVLYTGTGSSQSITGVGFQTDWTWIKDRDSTENHNIFDTVRTATKRISSNRTNAEDTQAQQLTAFGSDGFTVGTDSGANHSGRNYVSWNWLAGGTASSNSDGSITSSVSANTTAGFSIVSYTGTGSVATVGHGLGSAPAWIVFKNRDGLDNWSVYHQSLGNTHYVTLDQTSASASSSSRFNNTSPTTSVFTIGDSGDVGNSGAKYIAYCFAEKKGYSKFGSYTGNGNTDGPFIYTGFKPAWLMVKRTNTTGAWLMYDNKRNPHNLTDKKLLANETGAENASTDPSGVTALTNNLDILSNGFKWKRADGYENASGGSYIYMAFAEAPFVTSGTKAAGTAR